MKRWVGDRTNDEADEGRAILTASGGRPEVGGLAASLALRSALGREPADAREAGLAVLTVPEKSWVQPVAEAWRTCVRGGRKPERLGAIRLRLPSDGAGWTCVPQDGRTPAPLDDIEQALALGLSVVVVAHEAGWVPAALAASADLSATLAPLPWRMLRWAAMRAAGAPASCGVPEPSAAVLAAVTPRTLRLSSRPGGGAAGLLKRVLRIAEAEAKPAAASAARGLESVPGMEQATAWGYRLAADLADYRAGRLTWADVDRGLLLSGPPGTGKTTYARALAVTCGVPLVLGSHADWQARGHQGDLLQAMQATFRQARRSAPCILFLDEADSFPDRSTPDPTNGGYTRQVVNALLAEMDGASSREGVVVIAACNDPSGLDPALVRSGRLDRHIHLGLPTAAGLEGILGVHLGGALAGADLSHIAREAALQGLTGADIERLLRDARRTARVEDAPLRLDHVRAAVFGPDEDGRDPEILWRIAVHEAGHAVGHEVTAPGMLTEVSLRPRGNSGGRTVTEAARDEELTPSALRARLVSLLSGRAAEEVVLGEPGAGSGLGAASDLAQATRLAALAVSALGYDDEAGLVWQGLPPTGGALARWLAVRPSLAARMRERLADAQEEARRIVGERRGAVLVVAEALLRERTLTGEEVRCFIGSTARPYRDGAPLSAA